MNKKLTLLILLGMRFIVSELYIIHSLLVNDDRPLQQVSLTISEKSANHFLDQSLKFERRMEEK